MQKPAKLEFRIVNTNAEAPVPVLEGEEWTDDEGIPYVALLRSDAQPNERPIWVRRLWSADGEIIAEAYPRQDQMGGWEVGLDFTTEGGKLFGDLTGQIAQMSDLTTGMPVASHCTGWQVGKCSHSQGTNRRRQCGDYRELQFPRSQDAF